MTKYGKHVKDEYHAVEPESLTKYSKMEGDYEHTPNNDTVQYVGYYESSGKKVPGLAIEVEYYNDKNKPLKTGVIPSGDPDYNSSYPGRRHFTSKNNPSGTRWAINHPLGRFEINKVGDNISRAHGDMFHATNRDSVEIVGGDKLTKVSGAMVTDAGTIVTNGDMILHGDLIVEGKIFTSGGTDSKKDDDGNSEAEWMDVYEHIHEAPGDIKWKDNPAKKTKEPKYGDAPE